MHTHTHTHTHMHACKHTHMHGMNSKQGSCDFAFLATRNHLLGKRAGLECCLEKDSKSSYFDVTRLLKIIVFFSLELVKTNGIFVTWPLSSQVLGVLFQPFGSVADRKSYDMETLILLNINRPISKTL